MVMHKYQMPGESSGGRLGAVKKVKRHSGCQRTRLRSSSKAYILYIWSSTTSAD